jgi:hypothetical protein
MPTHAHTATAATYCALTPAFGAVCNLGLDGILTLAIVHEPDPPEAPHFASPPIHPPDVKSFSPDVVHEPYVPLVQLPPVTLIVTTLPSPHFMLVFAAKADDVAKTKSDAAAHVNANLVIVTSKLPFTPYNILHEDSPKQSGCAGLAMTPRPELEGAERWLRFSHGRHHQRLRPGAVVALGIPEAL